MLIDALAIGPEFTVYQTQANGRVWFNGISAFDNWTYNHNIQNFSVNINAKVILGKSNWQFHPFVTGGVGLSYLIIDYNEQSLLPACGGNINLVSRNAVNPNVTAGAGFAIDLPKAFRLGLSYRFQYLGKVKTNTQTGIGISLLSPIRITANTHNLLLTISHRG